MKKDIFKIIREMISVPFFIAAFITHTIFALTGIIIYGDGGFKFLDKLSYEIEKFIHNTFHK